MAQRVWLYPSNVERQYSALLRKMVREMAKETERQLRERQLLRIDSWSDDLTALFEYLIYFANGLTTPIIARLPSIYSSVSKFNDQQWRLVVKAGTGISIAPAASVFDPGATMSPFAAITKRFGMGVDVYRSEPWLAELQKNWVAKNTSLIKSVPTQYMARVEQIVRTGVIGGTSSREIAKQIKDASGVTDRRAMIIARNEVGNANAELTKYRQMDLGVKEYDWMTARDERVRGNPSGRFPSAIPSHYARQGKRFRWNSPPSGGHPGYAILCVPGSSNIEIAHAVKKLWRRRCSGDLAFAITASGKTIEATPNHPVLTNRGWVAMDEINVGDYLVNTCNQTIRAVENNVQARPAKIGEVFDTIARYVAINSAPISGLQFHGDAIDSEVDTIDIDSFLPSEIYSAIDERFVEFFFANANMALAGAEFGIDGALEHAVSILWSSGIETMRGFCKLLTFLNSGTTHSEDVRLATISAINAGLDKPSCNGHSIDSIDFGQFKLANSADVFGNNLINGKLFAILRRASVVWNIEANSAESLGEVVRIDFENRPSISESSSVVEQFDCIVETGRREFFGHHVYNLETESNWYSTNTLIIHNCRCFASPVFD